MEQKFVKFEEAVEKLGISAERLNLLRESGELRAYRDGSSWKFRGDEIERMATEGIPEPAPPSDIGLVDSAELVAAEPLKSDEPDDELSLADDDDLSLAGSGLELDMGDRGEQSGDAVEGSGVELAELDDTVTAGASDVMLEPGDSTEASDSILLSEEELGESVGAPASTIIGKDELAAEDADLQLASDDDLKAADDEEEVKLDSVSGTSDVLSSGIAGSGVLDELDDDSGGLSAFEDLDELEIDLAAESSRVLNPDEAAELKSKTAEAKPLVEGDSDLKLDDDDLAGADEGTDPVPAELELAGDDEGTDPVPEELELEVTGSAIGSDAGDSDIDLDTGGDDFVLADGSGSDITLGSGDSGINLVSPSDSGLALDDIPLEMGGSAILSSLSLGGDSDPDISLIASEVDTAGGGQQAIQAEEDFQLTPLGEADDDEEGDSSSQVIALDAGVEDLGASGAGILETDAFAEEDAGASMLTEDDSMGIDEGSLGVAAYSSAPSAARSDAEYTVWNILGLAGCAMLSLLAVIVLSDMIRSIDSWNEPYALNSSLLDAVLGKLGLIKG